MGSSIRAINLCPHSGRGAGVSPGGPCLLLRIASTWTNHVRAPAGGASLGWGVHVPVDFIKFP